jgi:3'-phosphoadenosine 5'-phosphosulfate sulfotransferase
MKLLNLLLLCLSVCTNLTTAQSVTSSSNQAANQSVQIYFGSDQDVLTEAENAKLELFLLTFRNQKQYTEYEVRGFTDAEGSAEYNQALSQRRTQSVIEQLQKAGVEADRIHSNWHGEALPIAENTSEVGKSQNRRVEVKTIIYDFSDIRSLLDLALGRSNEAQQFTRNQNVEMIIEGEQGTYLRFGAGVFTQKNGQDPVGQVHFSLREVYDAFDALHHGVHNWAGGKILESGGMFHIAAQDDASNELVLKSGATYTAELGSEVTFSDMKVFAANTENDGSTFKDWKATNAAFDGAPSARVKKPSMKIDESIVKAMKLPIAKKQIAEEISAQFPTLPTMPILIESPKKPTPTVFQTPKPMGLSWFFKRGQYNEQVAINKAKADSLTALAFIKYDQKRLQWLTDSLKNEAALADYHRALMVHDSLFTLLLPDIFAVHNAAFEATKPLRIAKMQAVVIAANRKGKLRSKDIAAQFVDFLSMSTDAFIGRKLSCPVEQNIAWAKLKRDVKAVHLKRGIKFYQDVELPVPLDPNPLMYNGQNILNDPTVMAFLEEIEHKTATLQAQEMALGNLHQAAQKVYTAQIGRLGWINCDRFAKMDLNTVAYIQIPEDIELEVFVIVKGINGVLPVKEIVGNGKHMVRLPANTAAKFVFVGTNEFLQPVFGEALVQTKGIMDIKADPKPTNLKALKQLMQFI